MELRFVLSGFRARKICRPSVLRVIGIGTDNEKHIAKSQTGWREKKRRGEGMNWYGIGPNFQVIFPPLPFKYREIYILSTQKCLNCMFS